MTESGKRQAGRPAWQGSRRVRAWPTPGLFVLVLLVALASGSAPARADDSLADSVLVGTVVRVIDGDSLRVRLAGAPVGDPGEIEVRLHGADAPEYNQAGGRAARDYLRRRVSGRRVAIEVVTQDRYERLVGVVLLGEASINADLVASGHAWAYRRYLAEVPGASRLCALEAEARAARRGLWSRPAETWVPPWLFRQSRGGEPVAGRYASETEADCRGAIPAARVPGARTAEPPAAVGDCRIKGNINSRGERIYHLPGSRWYAETRINEAAGERWFCTEADAQAAGWRGVRAGAQKKPSS